MNPYKNTSTLCGIWCEQTMIADLMYWYFTISYYMWFGGIPQLYFIQCKSISEIEIKNHIHKHWLPHSFWICKQTNEQGTEKKTAYFFFIQFRFRFHFRNKMDHKANMFIEIVRRWKWATTTKSNNEVVLRCSKRARRVA